MVGVPQWKATLNELLLVLWCTPPTDDLVSIYRRSKPLLQQRLTIDTVSPLVVATINQKEKSMIESLLTKIDQIVGKLNQSPLFVSNPEMVRVTVFLDENEQKLVNSWSRWTLEPVGALLPVPQDELAEQLASQIVEKHPVRLTVEQLIFNAYIYEFEKSLSRQNLREAMAFVPKIIDLLK
jgi:hypothetical protein